MADSDAQRVARALRGDPDAFGELVRAHLRAAQGIALAALGDPADAEDVCQEAFIVALERLEDCRDPARFAPWLFRIVRNRAHNHRRYRRLRETASLDAPAALAARSRDDPDRDLERSQLRQTLSEALQELPEVQREIVVLHDMNGWKHREIADVLGIPEGTVRAHLSYARQALRARMNSGELRGKD
jgi:RNA polymerase sigma-70 factor (ECF subfamily)